MKMRPDKPSIQNSPQVWRVQIRHSVVAQGAVPLHRALALILEERDNGVSEILRELLVEMSERQRLLEDRLKRYDQRITEFARADERAGRLMAVGGSWSADRHRADCRGRQRAAVP
jgi:hypothetical protein